MHRAGLAFALLVLAVPAAAYDESEAAELWDRQYGSPLVVATAHDPPEVAPGEQFAGTLVLRPGNDVEEVWYQVCIVAHQCIISPRPAERAGNGTWRYDTADFRLPEALGGEQHRWRSGQWIGVQWFVRLAGQAEMLEFPRPWEADDPRCVQEPVACSASHYFTFHVQRSQDASALGWLVPAALLVVTHWRRRLDG